MPCTQRLLSVFFFLAFYSSAFAQQWVQQAPFEAVSKLNDIVITADGYGWAVGENNTALYTENFGTSWTYKPTAIQAYNDDLTYAVILPQSNGQEALVASTNFNLLRTTDAGENWEVVLETPLLNEFFQELYIDPQGTIFALAKNLYISNDAGDHWDTLQLPNTSYGKKGFFLDNQHWWAGDFALTSSLYKTEDGGLSWTQPTTQTFEFIRSIHFFDQQNGLLLDNNGLYETSDGGQNWNFIYAPVTPNDMHVYDENTIVIAQGNGGFSNTEDGGQTWTTHYPDQTTELYSCTGLPNGSFWATGKYTSIFFTQNASPDDWVDQVGGYKGTLSQIAFTNADTGFVMGYETLLRTFDGGANWENLQDQLPFSSLIAFHVEAPSHIWLINTQGNIAFSMDSGNNWTMTSNLGASSFKKIVRSPSQELFLLSKTGQIWKSTDEGLNWNLQQDLPDSDYEDLVFSSSESAWIAGTNGKLYHSTDGGSTWSSVDLQTDADFKVLSFINENKGFIAGRLISNDSLWITEDGGQSWNTISAINFSFATDMAFFNENQGWIVGGVAGIGQIAHTQDGGQSWQTDPNSYPEMILSITTPIPQEEIAWICGPGGNILKWVTCSEETPVLTDISYEAPFCQGDTLSFSLSYENVDIFSWELPSDWLVFGNNTSSQVEIIIGQSSGYVTATGANTCDEETSISTPELTPLPTPPTPLLSFNSSTQTLSTDNLADSYLWFFNGQEIPNQTGPELTSLSNGSYTVIALNDNGCQSPPSEPLEVIIVGSLSANVQALQIFPNPVQNTFTITHLPQGTDKILQLYNAYGQLISSYTLPDKTSESHSFSIPEQCPSGLYFLFLKTPKGSQLTKLILER